MNYYKAEITDVLRGAQRDELFVDSVKEDIFAILKLFGVVNYSRLRKIVPVIANTWYYYVTSLSNFQTLGEEYTGTLRFTNRNQIPGKFLQICWLVFYVGGESIYDGFLEHLNQYITTNKSMTDDAKQKFVNIIFFLKDNKVLIFRLHHSLFYIYGTYYNISNHIAGIKYVLLRQWMQDDSSTNSFRILGSVSLIYVIYLLFQKICTFQRDSCEQNSVSFTTSRMVCSLCAENRKNTCATPCGHLFCWNCIYESLNYQQCCPICREVVTASRIMLLQNYD